jgi:hypothetical protein
MQRLHASHLGWFEDIPSGVNSLRRKFTASEKEVQHYLAYRESPL